MYKRLASVLKSYPLSLNIQMLASWRLRYYLYSIVFART